MYYYYYYGPFLWLPQLGRASQMSVNRVIVYTISRLLTTYVSGGDVCCTRKGGEKTVHYRPRVCVCVWNAPATPWQDVH